jgi:hypothetical protein
MSLLEEPALSLEIQTNANNSKSVEEEFPPDPDPLDLNFTIKVENVKGEYDEIIIYDFDQTLVLHDPKCCSKCR